MTIEGRLEDLAQQAAAAIDTLKVTRRGDGRRTDAEDVVRLRIDLLRAFGEAVGNSLAEPEPPRVVDLPPTRAERPYPDYNEGDRIGFMRTKDLD